MKSFRLLGVVAVLVVVLAPAAMAAEFGVRAGRYTDGGDNFVGAEIAFNIGRLTLGPNIEYIINADDDVTAGTGNFDVFYNFGSGTVRPYLGGGIGMFYVDTDFGDDTTTVVNAIGGLNFKLDFLKPYAQVKYFRAIESDAEGDNVALTVGLRF